MTAKLTRRNWIQPFILPRPDVTALGISYRRIPILAIGRDVYCDSRIILRKLEQFFPDGTIGASEPGDKALGKLLEIWSMNSGIFDHATHLLPTNRPSLSNPKFTEDRREYSGQSWEISDFEANRPEALVNVRNAFDFLETTILADGRKWVLKTETLSLADIEAIWPIEWLMALEDALPPNHISKRQFPKVFAWCDRFHNAVEVAMTSRPEPPTLEGSAALEHILESSYVENDTVVDEEDPLATETVGD